MYQDEYFHVTMPTVLLVRTPRGLKSSWQHSRQVCGKNRDGVCAGVPGSVRCRAGVIPAAERRTTDGKPPIARVLHEVYPSG